MIYSIVFSSRTGNTAQLAEVLRENLPREDCQYFGEPSEKALEAPVVFVGFWTDKGTCDEGTVNFLRTLEDKHVFLYGTAGFGGSNEYYEKILSAVKSNLGDSNAVLEEFMCQGKMPASVLERYQKMLSNAPDPDQINAMIENFHKAALHPNQRDRELLKDMLTKTLDTLASMG